MIFKLMNIKNLLVLSSIIACSINILDASDQIKNADKYSQNSADNNDEQGLNDNFKLNNDTNDEQDNDIFKKRKKIKIGTELSHDYDSDSSSSYYGESEEEDKTSNKINFKPKTIRDHIKEKKDCIGNDCIQNDKTYNSYSFASYATYSSSANNEGKIFSKRSMQRKHSQVDENGNEYSDYASYDDSFNSYNGEVISANMKAKAGFNNDGYTRDADVFARYNNKNGMDTGGNSYENKQRIDKVRQHYTVDESKDLLCDGSDCYGNKLVKAGKKYINKALGKENILISPYDKQKCLDGDINCITKHKKALKVDNKQYKSDIDNLYNNKSITKYNKNLQDTNKSFLEDDKYNKPLVTDSKAEVNKNTVLNKTSRNNNMPLLSDKPAFKADEYRKFKNTEESSINKNYRSMDNILGNNKIKDSSDDLIDGPIEPLI